MIKILSFSGLDGSGKSTQVDKVMGLLRSGGQRVFYFHATSFSLPQKIKRVVRPTKNGGEHSQASASTIGILLRKLVLPIDILRFKFLLKRLQRDKYGVVVSDRYFYDSIVNIAFLSNSLKLVNIPIKKPDVAFYIKTDVSVIAQRDRQPDQGSEYLHSKTKLYNALAVKKQLVLINGNQEINKVFKDIMHHLRGAGVLDAKAKQI